jgi:hypothetical protein
MPGLNARVNGFPVDASMKTRSLAAAISDGAPNEFLNMKTAAASAKTNKATRSNLFRRLI